MSSYLNWVAIFFLNTCNDIQRTLSSLELPRAVPIACGPSNLSVDESVLNENQERADNDVNNGSFSATQFHGRPSHKVDPARDLSIHVLEKFSLVTKFARETTSQLFRENHSNGFSERRTHAETNLDHHPRKSSHVEEKTSDESCIALDSQEVTYFSCITTVNFSLLSARELVFSGTRIILITNVWCAYFVGIFYPEHN